MFGLDGSKAGIWLSSSTSARISRLQVVLVVLSLSNSRKSPRVSEIWSGFITLEPTLDHSSELMGNPNRPLSHLSWAISPWYEYLISVILRCDPLTPTCWLQLWIDVDRSKLRSPAKSIMWSYWLAHYKLLYHLICWHDSLNHDFWLYLLRIEYTQESRTEAFFQVCPNVETSRKLLVSICSANRSNILRLVSIYWPKYHVIYIKSIFCSSLAMLSRIKVKGA